MKVIIILAMVLVPALCAVNECYSECPPGSPAVCGTDGVHKYQFNSVCAMSYNMCTTGRTLRLLKLGSCYSA